MLGFAPISSTAICELPLPVVPNRSITSGPFYRPSSTESADVLRFSTESSDVLPFSTESADVLPRGIDEQV